MLNGVDDLPHRQHHPSQLDEILTQTERLALQALLHIVLEQVVFEGLDAFVELLHRLEMPVDNDVEQAVHQRPHAVFLAAQLVEPLRHRVDVEVR